MIASRMMTENDRSVSRVAAYAISGAENAAPPNTPAGIASTPHGESIPPIAAATTKKAIAASTRRSATYAR